MTGSPRSNDLNYSLAQLFALSVQERFVLAGLIRRGMVSLPYDLPLILKPGISAQRIAGYQRDLQRFSPAGVADLHSQLQTAPTEKARTSLSAAIAAAPQRLEAAQHGLPEAAELQAVREAAFRGWIGPVRSGWLEAMVRSLWHNVTYVTFTMTPGDVVGTLYVEHATI